MLRIGQYHKAESLEEAYELLQKNRNNQIIAGMLWLKMEDRTIPIGIDLSKLQLDQIVEEEDRFIIGAMTSLRDLETSTSLNACFDDIFKESVKDIVGVQFRNMATIGGSLYSRFGFSDILTALLCLDCEVVLHHGGVIPLQTYVNLPYERDVMSHVIVHKTKGKRAFACVRKSATDLSVLNASMSKTTNGYRICIGARPQRAMMVEVTEGTQEEIATHMMEVIPCGDNMRGSEAYRKQLVYALVLRLLKKIEVEETC